MGDGPQRFGDGSGRTDGVDDERKSTHEHHVGLPADDPGADQAPQFLEMGVSGVAANDVISATGGGRPGLVVVPGDHGHGAAGIEPLEGRHRGQPDDPGTDDKHGIAVDRACPQQAVTGNGERLEQAGTPVGHRGGERGWSMVAWANTCSPHPPPRFWVKPRVRPELTTRLSRFRHDDVQPLAQLTQRGSMSRAAHGRRDR